MRFLPFGDAGVLVEVADLDTVLGLHAAVEAARLEGVVDLVAAARTLLVRIDPESTSTAAVTEALRSLRPVPAADVETRTVEVAVRYDGDDLEAVGEATGLGARGVVEAHTAQTWTVAFAGFAPGFGYLVGEDDRLQVPRRTDPRTRVPAGAVGLADRFSGVYPRPSPGGWQLIGRTDVPVWDHERDPPALFRPGVRVRFVEAP
ncbi:MAG TPA: allophanate hydrolase subunit 1 [Egicoccus sp.]|nr:allophanate hydrolase subunit 1 [Egicoccus sp.]HSK23589.1 allophanate hydrolase subunit 1 [Egicoccus sp.]